LTDAVTLAGDNLQPTFVEDGRGDPP
jgi:hypothetical protein